ncbi:hypothetical protein PHLCEN_2v12561 [Hermanssonia centrifuga]|uniref:CRIB domain-containing protein n=1 Tax=Hermanssonia centrifuga TaxID=98765 RepID=A0A2R6NHU3_9APHY|nr:hypothetical protein PHLCEN_2v12561 [Hermanssonia centrifuga]
MHSRSSSSSTMSDDTKRHLLACLPADSKIIATASARVYHAPFHGHSDDWVYSGLHGTLVFGRNRIAVHADKKLGSGPGTSFDQSSWFRLVDPIKGLVWLHQIPEIFDYSLDKPFFHIFSGKFIDTSFRVAASLRKSKKLGSMKRLSTAMISSPSPGTFVHVAHVGFDAEGRVETSDDIDPGWTMMLEELRGYGINKSSIDGSRDFIEGFLAGAKASTPTKETPPSPGALVSTA